MTNRRKFLLQGSFAATALLFTKPFKAIAGISSTFTNNQSFSRISILHTANNPTGIVTQARSLSGLNNNLLLLYTGNDQTTTDVISFDAEAGRLKENRSNSYTIINKGGIKTGVIVIPAGEATIINSVNEIAAFLKKEKDCKLVVFMSDLGFRNKSKIDDLTLASKSEHIDIIISKYNKDLPSQTFITYNKNRSEVIIQHQNDHKLGGTINIAYNEQGLRSGVSF